MPTSGTSSTNAISSTSSTSSTSSQQHTATTLLFVMVCHPFRPHCSLLLLLSAFLPQGQAETEAGGFAGISFNGKNSLRVKVAEYTGSLYGLLKLEEKRQSTVTTTWMADMPGILDCVKTVCVAGKPFYWKTLVNGEEVEKAADSITLKPGDVVQMKLQKINRKVEL